MHLVLPQFVSVALVQFVFAACTIQFFPRTMKSRAESEATVFHLSICKVRLLWRGLLQRSELTRAGMP